MGLSPVSSQASKFGSEKKMTNKQIAQYLLPLHIPHTLHLEPSGTPRQLPVTLVPQIGHYLKPQTYLASIPTGNSLFRCLSYLPGMEMIQPIKKQNKHKLQIASV